MLQSVVNELSIVGTYYMLHMLLSHAGTKPFLSFTDTSHQPPQANKRWFYLVVELPLET